MASDNGRFLYCPLCQGKGQMHRSDLIRRLSDPRIHEQLEHLLADLQHQEEEESAVAVPGNGGNHEAFEREVHSWPPRRILWRRSPKE